jgi:flavin-dependent dehydrogenase
VAHFAHFENFNWDDVPGQVLIARGEAGGWSWCIPLHDRLSVGIVLAQDDAARLGDTPEERLGQAIALDPWLSGVVGDGKRVTGVATYANYQLISERGFGPGWVMVGDAFGFVDPMLSPGVFLALRSAELVADALAPLLSRRTAISPAELAAAFRPYATAQGEMLTAWQELIAYFYDGRMVGLLRAGRDWMDRGPSAFKTALQNHIEKHIALQATGAATTSRYSRALLRFLGRHGMRGVDPAPLAIK